jgi:hypothetical protein
MDYNHIKDYLAKFRDIIFSKEEGLKIISEIIQKDTQIKIEPNCIQIKGQVIYIKASPLVRNEIMIKKEKILSDLLELKNIYKDIK